MRWLIQAFKQLLTPAAQGFQRSLADPQSAQQQVQQEICDRLIASEYGKFLGIRSVADWPQIPIVEYDDLLPWIEPQRGKSRLTPEPILFYEKTSGSRGAAKWIPYTRSLRRSFNQMFCIWAHDLIQHGPRFSTGKVYFCISPQLGTAEETKAALQDDSAYLDGWLRSLLSPFFVTPRGLNQVRSPETFKHQLCLALLQAEQLETISIWSPSFLTVHLDYIQARHAQLSQELQPRMSRDRRQLLTESTISWTRLWSELKLISCWDSANAADQALGLRSRFPGVLVQGKGLLATEAPMTIPLIAAQGAVPMLDEVFFEFAAEGADAAGIHLLHELQVGGEYTIILSQKGGLYRYSIGDRVRVTHFYRNTPCLEFLGRSGSISDLVGEKLQEGFVYDALASLNLEGTCFQSLIPVCQPAHYLLLLDRSPLAPETIAHQLDAALCRSPHYHHARLLGQLAPLRVLVSPQFPEILALHRTRSGATWGDIKHPLLATSPLPPQVMELLTEAATHSVWHDP